MTASSIFLFFRSLISRQKNISAKFFLSALKNENNGDFEEALADYEIALAEAKKAKHSKKFMVKIVEKIKVLHTVIQYQQNFLT